MTIESQIYPKYKDSNVEWAKNIPNDWDTKPLRYCCSENTQKNTTLSNMDILSLSYGNVILKDTDINFGLVPESYSAYQILDPGDIVMRLTDLQNDHVSLRTGLVKNKGIITSAYLGLNVRKDRVNDRFFHWLLHSYDLLKVFYGMGGGIRQTVGFDELKWLPILVPNIKAQELIANFLDRKTKVIDELVTKKEKLIELLREKRASLITHAVTKGLDPKAKMKPSGVEWLGGIPVGWSTTKLRREIGFQSGHGFPDEFQGEEVGKYPFLKVSDINGEEIHISSARNYVSELSIKSRGWKKIPIGSILTAKIGAALAVNHRKINDVECIIDNNMLAFILLKNTQLKHDYFFILSKVVDLNWFVNPGAVPSVDMFQLKELVLPVPQEKEQSQISDFLNIETTKISRTTTLIGSQIDQLKEYRSSLIYSAVTGKIKV